MQLKYRKWEGECPQIAPQDKVWVILAIAPPDTSGQLETLVFRGICSVYSDIPKVIMSECNVESTEDGLVKWQSFSMNHHFKTSPFGWPCVYSVAKQQAAWALEWAYLAFGESEKDRKRNGRNFLSHFYPLWKKFFSPVFGWRENSLFRNCLWLNSFTLSSTLMHKLRQI